MSNEAVFQAIADPTRREILLMLSKGAMHLNAIADQFTISRPAISKHIKVLTECGLIEIRREGRLHYCEACFDKLQPVKKFIQQFNTLPATATSTFGFYITQMEQSRKGKKKKNRKNKAI